MNMFWIHDYVDRTTTPSGATDATSASHMGYLEERLERMEIVCEAMWNLLKDRLEVSDEDMVARIAQLDQSDGVADGRVEREPLRCPICNRANSRRHDRCIYCGQPLKHGE